MKQDLDIKCLVKKQGFGESEGFTKKSWLVASAGPKATTAQAWGNTQYSILRIELLFCNIQRYVYIGSISMCI